MAGVERSLATTRLPWSTQSHRETLATRDASREAHPSARQLPMGFAARLNRAHTLVLGRDVMSYQ